MPRAACYLLAIVSFLTITGCARAPRPIDGPTITARHGMVVAVSPPAAQVGRDVLARGGNAVDAAVATAFALAVTWPEAGNIGGGGFMLIYPGNPRLNAGRPTVIDYRETAPAAATPTTLARPQDCTPYRMVGVPGTVRGLALAHVRFGRLPRRDLLSPAIALAADGFTLDAPIAASINGALARSGDEADELRRVLGKPGGGAWSAGDRLLQPDLAATLRRIADGGPDAFYTGPVADALVSTLAPRGGLITQTDLASYRAIEREPIHGTFRGYDVYAPPPPSSGGICLVEMLNLLEQLHVWTDDRWSPRTLHLMIEAMRYAFVDRAKSLGDPAFTETPPQLTTKEYAAQLAATIDPERATPSDQLAQGVALTPDEGTQTTHFSVIDADGTAVSNTFTLEESFGGRVMVRGCGFLLNNEMGDFNRQPGVTDRHGRIGTPPNQCAPGKRMLSSMTPTVVAKDGRALIVTGSPGGRTIINTVLCVLVNRLAFAMSPRDCVDAPRLSQTWFPDTVAMEPALLTDHADAITPLRQRGYTIPPTPTRQGDAHTIFVQPDGSYLGVADPRRAGAAAGY